MAIYGISDLHLSLSSDKPMDVFGDHWRDHHVKMAAQWDAVVGADDVVLCPGDLSWAMRLEEAAQDLAWIAARTGKQKVLTRGNHDYWWSAIGKVRRALPQGLLALQNDAVVVDGAGATAVGDARDAGDVVVCGSRLWSCPGALDFGVDDEKIYLREVGRLRASLEAGAQLANGRPLLAAIHYPPFAADAQRSSTPYSDLLEEFGVKLCCYGHLHGKRAHRTAFEGTRGGVTYRLIACDHLDFTPVQLWPLAP